MNTDNNNQDGAADVQPAANAGQTADVVSLSKSEYEELIGVKSSYGSLKREFKDLKKSFEEREAATKETKQDTGLLEKGFLRMAGITAEDEVELALSVSKKWGVGIDALVDDEDFNVKLKKLRDTKANELATSNVKGGQGQSQAKMSADYWIAKGTPPTASDVPDRKTRASIARAMMAAGKNNGKKFYND